MSDPFIQHHQNGFERGGPAWTEELRQQGLKHFTDLGYPKPQDEAWKYTRVAPILENDFRLGLKNQPEGGQYVEMPCLSFGNPRGIRLSFFNGHFSPDHSHLEDLPKGVHISSLREMLEKNPEALKPYLGKVFNFEKAPFAALNTAFINDGAFIHLEKGVVLERPIELFFISLAEEGPMVSHPHNLIVAETGSQASVVENFSGKKSDHSYFTNAVTEIVTKPGAVLTHYKLQDEVENSFHLSSLGIQQKADSSFASFNLSFGAALARHQITTLLNGPGATCSLNGLYMAHGLQHVDNQTFIDHLVPNCTSHEHYKGILSDRSHGVFNGQILVRPDAQKTNSSLTNNNLLLSREAVIDTKPLLEIFADDVKCSHGATIGRLDENQVFYCRSRGIDEYFSRQLLTYAFASEILHEMKIDSLRTELEKIILNRLHIGELSVEGSP